MNIDVSNHAALSDTDLLTEVRILVGTEREATARLIAALAEVDVRRLYLAEGFSSLFTYCTQVLHLSEHAAYGRIEAARAARKWPALLDLLTDGSVHLTAVTLLAPHLTNDNHRDVLAAARHKSKREVEAMVGALRPQLPVPSSVRRLPPTKAAPRMASVPVGVPIPAPSISNNVAQNAPVPAVPEPRTRMSEITPLAPEHYKVQFTVTRETHDKLRQAQDLLRHRVPNGDIAAIFDRALTLLVTALQRTRHAATQRPRSTSPCGSQGRYIPAAVKREVWKRDGGRCAFVGATAAVPSWAFSSITTSCRLPMAERRRPSICSCAVALITPTRRSGGLERRKRIWCENEADLGEPVNG